MSTTAPISRASMWPRIVLYAVLIVFAALFLMPLYVMLTTSFKTLAEIQQGNMLALPEQWTLTPWLEAWGSACIGLDCDGISGYFFNSIKIVIPAVVISALFGAFNGYVLTKWRFRGHKIVFGLILFGCFIPFQIILLPMARVLGVLHIANTTTGLVLVHIVYGIGFTTLFFRNYYETFPNELIRAAMLDGAGFFTIFFRILLPASGPIIVVTVIWQFTNVWNDFLFGVSFTSGENAPVTVALNNLVNSSTGVKAYNVNMAAAMFAAVPTLVVYVLAGKYFVRGLMSGSVKG
ncbi:carbohydrate ABC transporter permease [Phytohalomonas tamaricis]|uniref:carbohydrate ABC transporter permease n=1 Tax=Phytohalomonas tamaricis TaxID=2081032 RepID=UPI000D0B6B0C|nr:carbohydrate ABC transporter permease [Phytohalomonas tamaricis]